MRIGGARIRLDVRDTRCMVINFDPRTAERDPAVLRAVAQHRETCAAVYGSCVEPGEVRVGDVWSLGSVVVMATSIEIPTLSGDIEIPQFGLGVFQVPPEETVENVTHAIEAGYRHIDTARRTATRPRSARPCAPPGSPREELFITTKLWNDDQATTRVGALKKSLERLGSTTSTST